MVEPKDYQILDLAVNMVCSDGESGLLLDCKSASVNMKHAKEVDKIETKEESWSWTPYFSTILVMKPHKTIDPWALEANLSTFMEVSDRERK